MSYIIDIQHASNTPCPVTDDSLALWAETTVQSVQDAGELTLRIVDAAEITALNQRYRQQAKPTNVLAFPSHLPSDVTLDCPLLGDVIVCPEVLAQESLSANISLQAHWAHIIIHGVLHLLGFDHYQDQEATVMQTHEISLLAKFGFNNPYTEDHHVE